jgi:hypothetical protein
MSLLKKTVDGYMQKVSGIEDYCTRCLNTERWNGSIVLMVVDAAFTSIGLNYFIAVVPKVEEFNQKFVKNGRIKNLYQLTEVCLDELTKVWKNRRSWQVAKDITFHLFKQYDDRTVFRNWAINSKLENWEADLIGRINGVGLVTFQYLRMMGGIDTVMPDKIVKRVINQILEKAGEKPVFDNLAFIKKTEEIALLCGYRPIELCWMTWMVQPEGKKMGMDKYSGFLL